MTPRIVPHPSKHPLTCTPPMQVRMTPTLGRVLPTETAIAGCHHSPLPKAALTAVEGGAVMAVLLGSATTDTINSGQWRSVESRYARGRAPEQDRLEPVPLGQPEQPHTSWTSAPHRRARKRASTCPSTSSPTSRRPPHEHHAVARQATTTPYGMALGGRSNVRYRERMHQDVPGLPTRPPQRATVTFRDVPPDQHGQGRTEEHPSRMSADHTPKRAKEQNFGLLILRFRVQVPGRARRPAASMIFARASDVRAIVGERRCVMVCDDARQ
jgi:hypothetical protein